MRMRISCQERCIISDHEGNNFICYTLRTPNDLDFFAEHQITAAPNRTQMHREQHIKRMVKIGKYNYEKSTRKSKKLMVKVGGKTIHFGARDMEHFTDKTKIWKTKDHNDQTRRKSYLARAKGIKLKSGALAWKDPNSANYHAVRILW
jgi:hypothetical protein